MFSVLLFSPLFVYLPCAQSSPHFPKGFARRNPKHLGGGSQVSTDSFDSEHVCSVTTHRAVKSERTIHNA